MKRKVLLTMLAAVLLVPAVVRAQDTLVSVFPKNGYFYNSWIDSQKVNIVFLPQHDDGRLTGKCFYSKDTLQVYGIAAALWTYDTTSLINYELARTSWDNLWEYLGLLKMEADTFRWVSDSLYVHLRDTPISYYYDDNMPHHSTTPDPPVPVFERYFDSPVSMVDSFYVGITMQSWRREFDDTLGHYVGPEIQLPVRIVSYMPFENPWEVEGQVVIQYMTENTIHYLYDTGFMMMFDAYMFPILTPPPIDTTAIDTTAIDTTIVDTSVVDTTVVDTVGIGTVQLLERYVQLMPNPAGERVKVISSFGLRQVEVYDGAGRRVLQRPLTGYAADLDLTALPAGTYHVRITTLTGTVSKKLVVQRR